MQCGTLSCAYLGAVRLSFTALTATRRSYNGSPSARFFVGKHLAREESQSESMGRICA
jgi:hypothetical protein